jgi:transcriptional regulator with XRE-family HTH domain
LETQSNRIDMGGAVCDTLWVFHVGDVIRKLRQQQHLGVKELAANAGLNKGTVSAVERGENYTKETIEALAAGLNVAVSELFAPLSRVQSADEGTGHTRADETHAINTKSLTYSAPVSGVQRDLHNRSAGGSSDVAVASASPRIHDLTSALLHASAGFETLATQCREYRAALDAVTGAQVAANSGVKPKPSKSHRRYSRSRAGVHRRK